MSGKSVTVMEQLLQPNEFASSINAILAEYKDAVNTDVQALTKKVSREAAKNVKANISTAGIRGSGAYKKSIKAKDTEKSATKSSAVIYAQKPYYRLTHLLEFGHAVVLKGGRTPAAGKKTFVDARPHWAEAERKAIAEFEKQLKEAITKI